MFGPKGQRQRAASWAVFLLAASPLMSFMCEHVSVCADTSRTQFPQQGLPARPGSLLTAVRVGVISTQGTQPSPRGACRALALLQGRTGPGLGLLASSRSRRPGQERISLSRSVTQQPGSEAKMGWDVRQPVRWRVPLPGEKLLGLERPGLVRVTYGVPPPLPGGGCSSSCSRPGLQP